MNSSLKSANKNVYSDEIEELKTLEHPSMLNEHSPVCWESAEGARVYSGDREWIDFTSSVGVANAGHSNNRIIEAIRSALDEKLLTTYTFPHRARLMVYRRIRELLLESTGINYKTHFMSSGTEAVEAAVDVVRKYHEDKTTLVIISFFNAFHGNTLNASSLSGCAPFSMHQDYDGRTTYFIKLPYHGRQSQEKYTFDLEIKKTIRQLGLSVTDIGGVLIEPYQGQGVVVADVAFMSQVANFCKDHDALFIMDEIQAGFYRTGSRFALEYFNVDPDIICLGKGLTSSLPMSGVAVKDAIFDAVASIDIASTHSANPLACMAALASMEVLEDVAVKGFLPVLGDILASGLREIHDMYPTSVNYHEAFGLAGSLHFVHDGNPSEKITLRVVEACHANGLFVTGPHGVQRSFIRITPPLIISQDDLRKGLSILKGAVATAEAARK